MDLRTKKTKQAIFQAFLQLRKNRPLEKISVKELSSLAQINKATFYLHYHDIYDLSEQLQKNTIQDILALIPSQTIILDNPVQFTLELSNALTHYIPLITVLFSDSQMSILPICLESEIKKNIVAKRPDLSSDIEFNIFLSFIIHGSYYAYIENLTYADHNSIMSEIEKIVYSLMPKNGRS